MTHSIEYRRILTRMGYYNYQNGLIYRHLNQEGGWNEHLEHCRNLIMRTIEHFNPEKVTILGSGWLLDLPLAEMIEKTSMVCLVDIVHPPDVISQIRDLKRVEMRELDVTGGLIEEVWKKTRKNSFLNRLKSLGNITISEYIPAEEPGLVISLNILTQLETLLVKYLKKRSDIREEEFNSFRSEIQKKHIDFLSKYKSLLITDYEELFIDRSGEQETIPTLFTDLPQGKLREEWTWDFDLKGADYYNRKCKMKVVGLVI
jgi:hypothetical protein